MREILLVKFGEIFLKGQNRPYFVRMLVSRVKEAVKEIGGKVWVNDSRVFVACGEQMEECITRVTKVFGVHSVCPAVEMEKDSFAEICIQANEMMKDAVGTFKVVSRRSDKRYPLDSPQINIELGGYILEHNPKLTVDVHKPENILNVEIREMCYLYARTVMAVGGMPVGTNGRAALLLSGGIDSPVAGYMIAKRGVKICAVHFHSYPYTSDRAKEKVLTLAKKLAAYCGEMRIHVVPFTEIQLAIHDQCPSEYSTLIMRRFMMRIAQIIAENEKAQALITGESIGQVASQTMHALITTNSVVQMPVFRPLIGFDKQEIIDIATKIDTFETSSLPYEDCCTVFTPKHPVTHPKIERVEEAEKCLANADEMILKALETVEIMTITA